MSNSIEIFYIASPNRYSYHKTLLEINHEEKKAVIYNNIDEREKYVNGVRNISILNKTFDLIVDALRQQGYQLTSQEVNSKVPTKEMIRRGLQLGLSQKELFAITGKHGEVDSYYDHALITKVLKDFLIGTISVEYLEHWSTLYEYAIKDDLTEGYDYCYEVKAVLWDIADLLEELSTVSSNSRNKEEIVKSINYYLDMFKKANNRLIKVQD